MGFLGFFFLSPFDLVVELPDEDDEPLLLPPRPLLLVVHSWYT